MSLSLGRSDNVVKVFLHIFISEKAAREPIGAPSRRLYRAGNLYM